MNYYKNCAGCGCKMSDNPSNVGYTPKENPIYCQRCFKLMHYNENTAINEASMVSKHNIDDFAIKPKDYLFMVIDALNIDQTLIKRFADFQNLYIIVNKIDLLQNSRDLIKNEIKIRKTLDQFISHKYDVSLVSVEKNIGINSVISKIKKINKSRNIYVIGMTNVGKSSFINSLIKKDKDSKHPTLTVSQYKNTTLGYNKLFLFKHKIVDTPGILDESIIEPESKTIKKVRPINYIFKSDICFVVNNEIYVFIKADKLSNATFYKKTPLSIKKVISPTRTNEYKTDIDTINYNKVCFKQEDDRKNSISIGNLVAISFKNIQEIEVYTPKPAKATVNKGNMI